MGHTHKRRIFFGIQSSTDTHNVLLFAFPLDTKKKGLQVMDFECFFSPKSLQDSAESYDYMLSMQKTKVQGLILLLRISNCAFNFGQSCFDVRVWCIIISKSGVGKFEEKTK